MNNQSHIRLRICHRDPLLAAGLRAILRADPGLLVVDGDDETTVQVIVADYEQGLAFASHPIATADVDRDAPKVLVFTSRCTEADVRAALRAGVLGYLVQGCGPQDAIQAVRSVHRGARYFCPLASKRMADSLAHAALTEREIDVLSRLADGLSNKLIARHYGLAVGTIKSHVASILGKLGASSRTHAVVVAGDRGLVQRRPGGSGHEGRIAAPRSAGRRINHLRGNAGSREEPQRRTPAVVVDLHRHRDPPGVQPGVQSGRPGGVQTDVKGQAGMQPRFEAQEARLDWQVAGALRPETRHG